jgi:predicted CXXCH cytochrome family protein
MKILLAALFATFVLFNPLHAAQSSGISGAVAYTEPIQFDYLKNGTRAPVQFWLEFKGTAASGTPGDEDYTPESGAIYYYLVDMDKKQKVDNWLMGFSMMEGPPPSGPYPMTNITIVGNKATFTAFDMSWTVIDGGEEFAKDTVTVNDGFSTRQTRLYGGNLTIIDADLDAYAGARECLKCHEGAIIAMRATGGMHRSVACGDCHLDHPPRADISYAACLDCHEPHSDSMDETACGLCHSAHAATEVTYMYNLPSQYCAICHEDAAEELAKSQSKHSDMACALCHQREHKASSSCVYCHGAPHPEKMMKKPRTCVPCHKTAHNLKKAWRK